MDSLFYKINKDEVKQEEEDEEKDEE